MLNHALVTRRRSVVEVEKSARNAFGSSDLALAAERVAETGSLDHPSACAGSAQINLHSNREPPRNPRTAISAFHFVSALKE